MVGAKLSQVGVVLGAWPPKSALVLRCEEPKKQEPLRFCCCVTTIIVYVCAKSWGIAAFRALLHHASYIFRNRFAVRNALGSATIALLREQELAVLSKL